ncbi:hypothetical protein V2J09_004375 [Rumex salicifolius]
MPENSLNTLRTLKPFSSPLFQFLPPLIFVSCHKLNLICYGKVVESTSKATSSLHRTNFSTFFSPFAKSLLVEADQDLKNKKPKAIDLLVSTSALLPRVWVLTALLLAILSRISYQPLIWLVLLDWKELSGSRGWHILWFWARLLKILNFRPPWYPLLVLSGVGRSSLFSCSFVWRWSSSHSVGFQSEDLSNDLLYLEQMTIGLYIDRVWLAAENFYGLVL